MDGAKDMRTIVRRLLGGGEREQQWDAPGVANCGCDGDVPAGELLQRLKDADGHLEVSPLREDGAEKYLPYRVVRIECGRALVDSVHGREGLLPPETGLRCAFALKGELGLVYHSFASRVRGVVAGRLGDACLDLELPREVEKSRRQYLRHEPRETQVVFCDLWPGKAGTGQETNYRGWDRPLLSWPRMQQVAVLDISAKGIRLGVRGLSREEAYFRLAPGRTAFLRFALDDDRLGWSRTFTVNAGVRHMHVCEDQARLEFGLEFLRQAGEGIDCTLSWRQLDQEGIAEVGDWVFQRHLAACRVRQG